MKEKLSTVCELTLGNFAFGGVEKLIIDILQTSTNPNLKYFVFVQNEILNPKLRLLFKNNVEIYEGKIPDGHGLLGKIQLYFRYKKFFQEHQFDIVHVHGVCNGVDLSIACMAAKKAGCRIVVAHSHNGGVGNFYNRIKRKMCQCMLKKYADYYMACSHIAAEWMLPKNVVTHHQYKIIKNGIDVNKFIFNENIRNEYRKDLNLNNEFVICHVGRFTRQKNHAFLVELAQVLSQREFKFKFILVGVGPLQKKIMQKFKANQLAKHIIFLEKCEDVPQLMMASDMFVLPSFFEGLPLSLIEAQATGLKCVASNQITSEAVITNLVDMLPISDVNVWADCIMKSVETQDRKLYAKEVSMAGYDITDTAHSLEKIYLSIID